MKRGRSSSASFATILALASLLAGIACSVQKTEKSALPDTTTLPTPAPTPVPVAPPGASTGGTSVEDSGKTGPKPAPKPAVKTPTAGGERDSAVQPAFEIGPDGKIRRVKR